jgi:hypothetical protein
LAFAQNFRNGYNFFMLQTKARIRTDYTAHGFRHLVFVNKCPQGRQAQTGANTCEPPNKFQEK